jgi:hypothetical protein
MPVPTGNTTIPCALYWRASELVQEPEVNKKVFVKAPSLLRQRNQVKLGRYLLGVTSTSSCALAKIDTVTGYHRITARVDSL